MGFYPKKYSSSFGPKRKYVECYICTGPHYASECPRKNRKRSSHGGNSSASKRPKKKVAWEGMKVTELKAACKERGLHVSGVKAVLVKRLQEYVLAAPQRKAEADAKRAAASGVVVGVAACTPVGKGEDVYALFDVEDDSQDAAMANAVSNFEAESQSSKVASASSNENLKVSSSNSKMPFKSPGVGATSATATANNIELGQSASSANNNMPFRSPGFAAAAQALFTPSSTSTPASVSLSSTPNNNNNNLSLSLSQSSQKSVSYSDSTTKKSVVLTEEQKERMRLKREEAQRKKMARLSAGNSRVSMSPQVVWNGQYMSLSQSQGSVSNCAWIKGESGSIINSNANTNISTPTKRKPASNPYLNKSPIKRDESGPPDETSLPLSSLPPLPADMPLVREETSKKLSDEQLEVIMTARPPTQTQEATKDDSNPAENIGSSGIGISAAESKNASNDEKKPPTHPMVRVNAAAGTGKTTTLLHLATRCIDLGHPSLTYVTFSRASAKDAQDRIQDVLDHEHKHCVGASTIHSCAMRLLMIERNELGPDEEFGEEEEDKRVHDDHEFENLLRERWGEALEDYVAPAVKHIQLSVNREDSNAVRKLDGRAKLLFGKALFFLKKAFTGKFLTTSLSLEELKDRKNKFRHHFSLTKEFRDDGEKPGAFAKLGFPPSIYNNESHYAFFADRCVEIWEYVVKHGYKTYDIEMKKAQLKMLRIPCSVLLVDECQDLDECQVTWLAGQKKFGTHIYFVGDSAQSIYGFRGAKSKYVMRLKCVDTKLTKSWRFGPEIANMANIPLFAKENSAQTTKNLGNKRLWIPYRVVGALKEDAVGEKKGVDEDGARNEVVSDDVGEDGVKVEENVTEEKSGMVLKNEVGEDTVGDEAVNDGGTDDNDNKSGRAEQKEEKVDRELKGTAATGVTTKSLMANWRDYKPLALIGTTNTALMIKALDLLGLSELKSPDYVVEDSNGGGSDRESCTDNPEAKTMIIDPENLPKFHINGKGDSSGSGKWRKVSKQIDHLYELFTNRDETGWFPMKLPAKEFKEFANEDPVTWDTFHEICAVKEIKTYVVAANFVSTYKQNTPKAMESIASHVLAKKFSAEEADIILTTCHSAKGLEWDHVEICDDIFNLHSASFTDSLRPRTRHPSFLKALPPDDQIITSEPLTTSLDESKGEMRRGWQFILVEFQDQQINMLYVALTRARKTLSLPPSIKTLLQEFDQLHYLVNTFIKDASATDGRKAPHSNDESMIVIKNGKKLTKGELWNLYYDLCLPLRKELGIPHDSMIMKSLFPGECEEDESMESKIEVKPEIVVKSEARPQHVIKSRQEDNVADYFDV